MKNSMGIRLDEKQISERLNRAEPKRDLARARDYESVLRILTEPMFREEINTEIGWLSMLASMKQCLSGEKMYNHVTKYINYPLPVVNISTKNLSDIYKVFDSSNAEFHYHLSDRNRATEIEAMIRRMSPVSWIEECGRDVLRNKPCSIVVVDKDDNGDPYLILVDTSRLIDAEFKDGVSFEWLTFVHSLSYDEDGTCIRNIAHYDSYSYRVYAEDPKDGSLTLMTENEHSVGLCPARCFISTPLNAQTSFSRWSPLASTISKMHEWTAFDCYKRYADHYSAFPMIQRPEQRCSVEDCHNGVIIEERVFLEGGVTGTQKVATPCAACSSRDTVGPGVVIETSVPTDSSDPRVPDTKFIETPVKSLEYLQKKLDEIERSVSINSTGVDKLLELEAVNEQQVNGAFESRKNVLLNIKKHFDSLYGWILETSVALVAPNVTISVHGDFGTDFY